MPSNTIFINAVLLSPTTAQAGNISITGGVSTGGNLTFTTAASSIIPGSTSLSVQNNANNASNISILDNGNITLRGTLSGITTLGATTGNITTVSSTTIGAVTGNITTVNATTVGGTLSTAAQPNITSVGILASPHFTSPTVNSGGMTITGTLTLNTVLAYGSGGTGATGLTQHGVVVAGASALTTVAPGSNTNVLTSNGTDWTSAAAPGPIYAAPALTLGTANSAGSASSTLHTDATILAFDTTTPVTQAFSDAAAVGTATVAARRDHKHGMPANPVDTTIIKFQNSADNGKKFQSVTSATVTTNTVVGNGFYSLATVSWPATFASTPVVQATAGPFSSGALWSGSATAISTTSLQTYADSFTTGSAGTVQAWGLG